MSHGTSLNDAYSLLSENKEAYEDDTVYAQPPKYYQPDIQPPHEQEQQQQQDQYKYQPQQQQQQPITQKSSLLPRPQVQVQVPAQQQQAPQKQQAVVHHHNNPSYFDQLGNKRKEILKVVGYALMILFALTLYTGIDFWLKDLVEKNDLSFKQELGIRMAYPLLVLFVLWNFKLLA